MVACTSTYAYATYMLLFLRGHIASYIYARLILNTFNFSAKTIKIRNKVEKLRKQQITNLHLLHRDN